MVGRHRQPPEGQARPVGAVVEDPAQTVGPDLRVMRGQYDTTVREKVSHQVGRRRAIGH